MLAVVKKQESLVTPASSGNYSFTAGSRHAARSLYAYSLLALDYHPVDRTQRALLRLARLLHKPC
jgi:hypothetical protein